MKEKSFTVNLKCLFCDCPLEGDTSKEYSSSDMIKCQNCKEFNNYDALIDVATNEGKTIVADYAKDEISKMLKKAFKN